jgi:aldehyde:ferredoxin oxidoreductase
VVYTHENIYSIIDAIGICKFVCHGFNSPKLLKFEHHSEMLEKAFGAKYSEGDLQDVALRIVDLERAFNNREGVRRPDDTLPRRYFDEPMPDGVAKGHKIDREEFKGMLDRYYKLRKWDEEGIVPDERVSEITSLFSEITGGVEK